MVKYYTFDTVNYNILIVKLYAYGFKYDTWKILYSYLAKWLQKTKVSLSLNSWEELIKGVRLSLCWGQFCLIYIWMIYSASKFVILQMTQHFMLEEII